MYNESQLKSWPINEWRRRAGGQLKIWATTIKADLEPFYGPGTMDNGQGEGV